MKIVTVFSGKGGCGKTMTAGNLAVTAMQDGNTVALIDLDPQGSCSAWWAQRGRKDIPIKTSTAAELRKTIATERRRGVFDLLVLDTPPTLNELALVGLEAADFVVVPIRPAIFDLRAIVTTIAHVRARRKPHLVVISSAPPPRESLEAPLARETREALAATGARIFRGQISQRVAISYAAAAGLTVVENEPDGRSAREYSSLWQFIREGLAAHEVAA